LAASPPPPRNRKKIPTANKDSLQPHPGLAPGRMRYFHSICWWHHYPKPDAKRMATCRDEREHGGRIPVQ
jgi:hypothetical protein